MGIEGIKSQDNTTMWYNGPYVISEFIMDNTKVFTPNPTGTRTATSLTA